jgi:hypothetical protein
MTSRLVLGAVALLVAYTVARNMPDIRRYIKIRKM